MQAFIVRPFKTKNGVDFDRVERELVVPVLQKVGVQGFTTAAILKAGNIREDMFQLLLTSDLVIADISIHNANVFYELGIRHALRPSKTFLIRCRRDDVPFDLKTDRYFAYDHNDPSASITELERAIRDTLRSTDADSPVYKMLPALKTHDTREFLAVPGDFTDELDLARRSGKLGKLRLLAHEVTLFPWALPALQGIGREQFDRREYEGARFTWELVLKRDRNDIEAHNKLATVYQRLAEQEVGKNPRMCDTYLAKSDQHISFLLDQAPQIDDHSLTSARSLKSRNLKWRWCRVWEVRKKKEERQVAALRSGLLIEAYESYLTAYYRNLNAYYPAINALGLLKIILDLAKKAPRVWQAKFDTDEKAERALKDYKERFKTLSAALRNTLTSKQKVSEISGTVDVWLDFTKAEYSFLTSDNPERVALRYHNAIEMDRKMSREFNLDSSRRQIRLYKKLGILTENAKAVWEEYKHYTSETKVDIRHVILFTGHMIDAPDRKQPRFPKEREPKVREKIQKELQQIVKRLLDTAGHQKVGMDNIQGVAGGACGGDILFHEACLEMGIRTEVLLALPREKFIPRSVSFAGNTWVDRFNMLHANPLASFRVLIENEEIPEWLQAGPENYSFWERNNLWILNTAICMARDSVTLLALWDGKKGDGPGGTQNMIAEVKKIGGKTVVIKP